MKDNPNNYYEDERVIGEEGWEEVDEDDVSRSMSQDDVAIAITPSIDEGGSLFTKIEIITCDVIRGGTHLFKKGTRYIIGKFLNQLSNIFVSELGRMFQVWFLNKFNDLVNDMAINVFSGYMNEEAVNFNLRYIDTIYNYDDIIPMGLNLQNKSVQITSNGETNVEPDFGYQGLGEVNITTNVPEKRLQSKTVSINTNGFEQVYPDTGYQGLSYVTVNTNVPSVVNNQNKSVTIENNGFQQVLPDQGYSGIGELNLTVDVPQPVIQDNDIRYIVPSNEARQIIVEPSQGFDALEKVTLNVASALLVTDQNILSLTSNGTYSLPSLSNSQALGFADSCTVNVNVSTNSFVLTRCDVGYYDSPTGGNYSNEVISFSSFSSVDGNSLNVNQQYGYVFVYRIRSVVYLGYVVPSSNNGIRFENDVEKIYYYSLGPAKYIERVNFSTDSSWITQVRGSFNNNNAILGHPIIENFSRTVISASFFEE